MDLLAAFILQLSTFILYFNVIVYNIDEYFLKEKPDYVACFSPEETISSLPPEFFSAKQKQLRTKLYKHESQKHYPSNPVSY